MIEQKEREEVMQALSEFTTHIEELCISMTMKRCVLDYINKQDLLIRELLEELSKYKDGEK